MSASMKTVQLTFIWVLSTTSAALVKTWNKTPSALQRSQAVTFVNQTGQAESCNAADSRHRSVMQNKLASICVEMCKDVGAYPNCAQCPDFVKPESSLMTWDKLFEHMDNLAEWGRGQITMWEKTASTLQRSQAAYYNNQSLSDGSCVSIDLTHRQIIQNKLADHCQFLCKGNRPCTQNAECPEYANRHDGSSVLAWDDLLADMDVLELASPRRGAKPEKVASNLQKFQTVSHSNGTQRGLSCAASELANRANVQNSIASWCEEMCKAISLYPKCAQCPDFVKPDETPGVMTWNELLAHMDNLVEWGHGQIKNWEKTVSTFQRSQTVLYSNQSISDKACIAADMHIRSLFQNRLAGSCEEMCKEVLAYPKCNCPNMAKPDPTPGVMTWDEVLEHMENLSEWGHDTLKKWSRTAARAAAIQVAKGVGH